MGTWLCNFFAAQGHSVTVHEQNNVHVEGFEHRADLEEAVQSADVIALATPIGETNTLLGRVLAMRPSGLVFDICSLKSPLIETLQAGARQGLRVASLHPMFAPDTVLLSGRVLLVCDCGNPTAAAEARSLFEDTALRLVDVPLGRHDRYMGYVLGLSHAINIAFASTLVESGLTAHDLDRVASTTFSKQVRTTREVAMENARLYYEVQHANAHTPDVLDHLLTAVLALREASLREGSEVFEALMETNRDYFSAP